MAHSRLLEKSLGLAVLACCMGLVNSVAAATLDGWQGMRVIKQEGSPTRLVAADLDGSGRKQLIVANTRLSRLDIYRWLPPADRAAPTAADPQRPNELPLAPDWSHAEIDLDELPLDMIVRDLDGDDRPEVLLLTSPSNKVLVYKRDAAGAWQKGLHWDLLAGTPSGTHDLVLLRQVAGKLELLASFEQGIQTLRLEPGSRPAWLSPREARGRLKWKLLDLDGDGDLDLWEWSQQTGQTLRWYEARHDKLLPAQSLYDQPVQGADGLTSPGQPAELLVLGGVREGLLRRYAMARGEENDLGRRESLPMPGGTKSLWTGLMVGELPALAAVDPAQPRLRVQGLGPEGWLEEQSYPIIGGVRGLAAPQAQPGTLLLWAKDAADLHISHWEPGSAAPAAGALPPGRMTYPQPMPQAAVPMPQAAAPQAAAVADRAILALGSVGGTAWWAQRVGADLDLHVWEPGQPAPTATRFAGLGTKADKVVWLGGQRVLVQPAFATSAKFARLVDGKLTVSDPSHLAKVDLAEFGLFGQKDPRLGRLTDGVLQWLGDDLHPIDQIMLPEGQRLAGFVPLPNGEAWALEQGGALLHRLKPDEAGILRVAASIKPPAGLGISLDPVLGLMLADQDRLVRVSSGQPWELALRDSLDGRVGRPSGVKEATIHRVLTTDVTGDGQDDVVLCDDLKHHLTVLGRNEKGPSGGEKAASEKGTGENRLEPLLSWPVFEDRTYPYGGQQGAQVAEPRAIAGFDADGDSHQDLALLCQDRLLIYMARETK